MIRVQFNNPNASSSNMAMSHNYGRNQNIFVCIFVKHTRKEYFRKHERLTQYSISSILLLHFSLFIFVSLSIVAQKRYCKDHLILRTLAGSSVQSLAISDVAIFNTVFRTLRGSLISSYIYFLKTLFPHSFITCIYNPHCCPARFAPKKSLKFS